MRADEIADLLTHVLACLERMRDAHDDGDTEFAYLILEELLAELHDHKERAA